MKLCPLVGFIMENLPPTLFPYHLLQQTKNCIIAEQNQMEYGEEIVPVNCGKSNITK